MTAADQAVTRIYTVSEVLALTNVPYRFIDHACRAGYLRNSSLGRGSGTLRRFTEDEIDTIHAARSLIDAGFSYAAAWDIAASLVEHGEHRAVVGSIYEIAVTVRDTSPEPPAREDSA